MVYLFTAEQAAKKNNAAISGVDDYFAGQFDAGFRA